MQRLIKCAGGAVTVLDDGWLRLLAGEARPAEGDILLSLADWLAGRAPACGRDPASQAGRHGGQALARQSLHGLPDPPRIGAMVIPPIHS